MISAPDATIARPDLETHSIGLALRGDAFEISSPDAGSPTPTQLFGASIAMCLAASLLHCLRKGRVPVAEFEATAVVTVGRNERGRLRVKRVNVLLDPAIGAEYASRLERCATLFEDYCTVTDSVRQGIDVRVTVAAN